MTYEEAVAYVKKQNAAAYTFTPERNAREEVIGGQLYVIWRGPDNQEDPEEYGDFAVDYMRSHFHASSFEADCFLPDEVPDEARALRYEEGVCEGQDLTLTLNYGLDVILSALTGQHIDLVLENVE